MLNVIDPKTIPENTLKLIGDDWMLISAGSAEKFNTMTASWGSLGVMWGKPCAFIFVRPQRYTHEFVEMFDTFSLSFFAEEYRNALKICGAKSGRNCDKIAQTKLTAAFTSNQTPYFKEAKLVLECKKMYSDNIKADSFIDKTQIARWYPQSDFHTMYIAEIISALAK